MTVNDVKLLGYANSPYFNRVQIALNLKSVKYEVIEEIFGTKSELLLKSNPVHKKFPVLIHNDKPICESMIIVQYIDDAWKTGPSILPCDPYDRAIARFWAAYIDEWFHTIRNLAVVPVEELGEAGKLGAKEQCENGLVLLEDAFVKCSKGGEYFGGDNIGYIDISMGSVLGWLKASEKMGGMKLIDETKTPFLAKWAEKFLSHQAVASVIPEADTLIKFASMILQAKAEAPPSN